MPSVAVRARKTREQTCGTSLALCRPPTHSLLGLLSLSRSSGGSSLSLGINIFATFRREVSSGLRPGAPVSPRLVCPSARSAMSRSRLPGAAGACACACGEVTQLRGAKRRGGRQRGECRECPSALALGEGGGWGGGGEGGVLSQIICFRCHLGCHIIRYKLCVGCTDGETTARGMSTEQDLNCLLRR